MAEGSCDEGSHDRQLAVFQSQNNPVSFIDAGDLGIRGGPEGDSCLLIAR